ncbi:hypothetical protein LJC35_03430 [Parabacteroides sp. OttesenSCG-928-N08]|nr:hypothetical protein [Parabacteroides sp. OttesenSCG-928-N08]
MNAHNTKVLAVIENTLVAALEKLTNANAVAYVSDLYLQVDRESGELQIYDDKEQLLEKVIIFDWVNSKEKEQPFQQKVIATLKAVMNVLSAKNQFDGETFTKPFSVSLTDEYFAVIEELLYVDEENYRLDDPLLKDLDSELDEFLANLLSDLD